MSALLDPGDVTMKLELLDALADYHECKHLNFWRAPKGGAACALGPLALLESNSTVEDDEAKWKLLTFMPRRKIKTLAFIDRPRRVKIKDLVRYWPSYAAATDLAISLVEKIQKVVESRCDILGRHVEAFEYKELTGNEEWVYEDIVIASSKNESLEKIALERRLNYCA